MLEFRVNELITLKLEYGQTHIYLGDRLFRQCKFLLLEIPVCKISSFDEIGSIDEAVDRLDKSMEINPSKIPTNVEFWAHCSNIQVWTENNYNSLLLHSNLSFPLLKELCRLGDPIAKKCFKEEIAKRLASGYVPVIHYLLVERYLDDFNQIELEVIFQKLENFLVKIEKTDLDYEDLIFEIFIRLTRLNFLKAQKILTKIIINTFNLGDFEQFLQLMSFEPFRYLEKEEVYWDFFSSATKYFFENLYQTANMDFDKYLEENPDVKGSETEEELSNIIFLAQRALNSLDRIPDDYYVRFLRNLASFPIENIGNILDLVSEDNYYLDDVKEVLNDNWSKFKNVFVKVKDKFVYVNRDKKSLVMKNLNITSISEIDNIERFGFLEELNLSNNKISKISNLDKLSRLKELNLSFNQIESVKDLGYLPNLERLILVGNNLSQLEESKKFSNLRVLDLEKNLITNIESLYKLEKLEYLNLSANKIQILPKFIGLKNLNHLVLSKNDISRIDFSIFENLERLRFLSLYDNKINSIKGYKHLKKLKNLEEIRINNNPVCKKKITFVSMPRKLRKLFYY